MEKLYGVMGDPISHSMSPIMHNSAFNQLGISAKYMAFHVTPDRLPSAVDGIRGLGISGINVTIPHKVSIMNHLDEIDPLALKIGAVNTVVNENGKLKGYNTDGVGFVHGLKELLREVNISSQSILLIGAGGAAKAIYFSLLADGVHNIDIANRTVTNAQNLINSQSASYSKALSLENAEQALANYDIVINTTSIGMYPIVDEVPIELGKLKNGAVISDIIYNPLETKWLKQARELGAVTQNGVDMFIYQGALSFEKWTGIYPDIEHMRKVVLTKLGGVY
jgi:shikimate dehydrogenase